jgi:hypothetical protein
MVQSFHRYRIAERLLSFVYVAMPPARAHWKCIGDAVASPMEPLMEQKVLTEISCETRSNNTKRISVYACTDGNYCSESVKAR